MRRMQLSGVELRFERSYERAIRVEEQNLQVGSPGGWNIFGIMFWSAVRKHGGRPAQEWYEDGAWKGRTYSQYGAAVRDVAHGAPLASLAPLQA